MLEAAESEALRSFHLLLLPQPVLLNLKVPLQNRDTKEMSEYLPSVFQFHCRS